MRKIIYSLVTVLVLITAVGPYVTGVKLKSDFQSHIAYLNQNDKFQLTVDQYHDGWFSSDAKISLSIKDPILRNTLLTLFNTRDEKSPDLNQIHFDLHINHGPFVFTHIIDGSLHPSLGLGQIYSRLVLEPEVQQSMEKYIGDSPLFECQTSVYFNGDAITSYHSPIVNIKTLKGVITWGGIHGAVTTSRHFDKIDAKTTFKSALFDNGNFKFTSEPITSDGAAQKGDGNLWFGHNTIAIPKILGQIHSQTAFVLDSLEMHTNTVPQENNFSSNWRLGLEKIKLGNINIGPGELKLSFDNLNIALTAKLRDLVNEMNNTPSLSSQRKQEIYRDELTPKIIELLQQGVLVKLEKFHLTTPFGNIDTEGALSFPQKVQRDQTVKQLAEMATLNLHLSVPPLFAEAVVNYFNHRLANFLPAPDPVSTSDSKQFYQQESQSLLSKWKQAGFIIENGNSLVVDVKYADHEWRVNDKLFSTIRPSAQVQVNIPTIPWQN